MGGEDIDGINNNDNGNNNKNNKCKDAHRSNHIIGNQSRARALKDHNHMYVLCIFGIVGT